VSEAAHAELRQSQAAAKPPGTFTPASTTRAPVAKRLHGYPKFGGALDVFVREHARALVHAEVSHWSGAS